MYHVDLGQLHASSSCFPVGATTGVTSTLHHHPEGLVVPKAWDIRAIWSGRTRRTHRGYISECEIWFSSSEKRMRSCWMGISRAWHSCGGDDECTGSVGVMWMIIGRWGWMIIKGGDAGWWMCESWHRVRGWEWCRTCLRHCLEWNRPRTGQASHIL